jgi:Tat protein translocase TatB subunit
VSLGSGEILVVLVVALIVLGPDRLPKAARQVGQALRELKKLSSSVQDQVQDVLNFDDDETSKDAKAAPDRPSNPDISGFTLIDTKAPRAGDDVRSSDDQDGASKRSWPHDEGTEKNEQPIDDDRQTSRPDGTTREPTPKDQRQRTKEQGDS